MGGRGLAMFGAILFVALAITAALMDDARKESAGVPSALITAPLVGSTDPLAGELQRCQLLGEAGAHDAACLAVWAENRRRFLEPTNAAPVNPSTKSNPQRTASEGMHQP